MNIPDLQIDQDIGLQYSGTLGVLDKEATKFISSSRTPLMLGIYVGLMVYIIGGLNVLKLKFLYPSLEDLCSIYADVTRYSNPEKTVLPQNDHLRLFHECRPVLLSSLLHDNKTRSLRYNYILLLRCANVQSALRTNDVCHA